MCGFFQYSVRMDTLFQCPMVWLMKDLLLIIQPVITTEHNFNYLICFDWSRICVVVEEAKDVFPEWRTIFDLQRLNTTVIVWNQTSRNRNICKIKATYCNWFDITSALEKCVVETIYCLQTTFCGKQQQ